MSATTNTAVRWLIRRDMPDVLRIESESFDYPWDDDDFLSALRQRNCIGMVTEVDFHVVGFIVYELHPKHVDVLNVAVSRRHRRRGVGAAMIERLKLSQQRRNSLQVTVRESNLDALLFFKSQGFAASELLREHYGDTGEDGISMRFHAGLKLAGY